MKHKFSNYHINGAQTNESRERQWVKSVRDLVNIPTNQRIEATDTIFCILTEIRIYYIEERHPHSDIAEKLLRDIIKFQRNGKDNKKRNELLNHSQTEINSFFCYFMHNDLWLNYDYPNEDIRNETLDYLEEYIHAYTLWNAVRQHQKNYEEQDIRKFAMALYDRNKLPNIDEYCHALNAPDDIIEMYTSFHFDR